MTNEALKRDIAALTAQLVAVKAAIGGNITPLVMQLDQARGSISILESACRGEITNPLNPEWIWTTKHEMEYQSSSRQEIKLGGIKTGLAIAIVIVKKHMPQQPEYIVTALEKEMKSRES